MTLNNRISTILGLALCLPSVLSPVLAQSNALGSGSAPTRYIFAFGDSYTATGFNVSKTAPTPGNPLGNPEYPGYTSSGYGNANWIDILVYDKAPANTLCYNFAWLGATVSRKPNDPPNGQFFTFTDQIEEFQEIKSTVGWRANNTLFTTWFGVNDIALNTALGFPLENGANATNRYEGVATPYFEQLDILYQAGARDYLVLTVPPLDRAPIAVRAGVVTAGNILTNVSAFNQVLKDEAQVFLNAHSEARLSIVDTSVPFNQVLSSPGRYGVSNVTCEASDGHTCLWSNGEHPAVAIHQALSDTVFEQLSDLGFWNDQFNAGPVEASPVSTASSSGLGKGTIWLAIFLAGIAIGRSISARGHPQGNQGPQGDTKYG